MDMGFAVERPFQVMAVVPRFRRQLAPALVR